MKSRKRATTRAAAPFLLRIESVPDKVEREQYPFNIRAFSRGIDVTCRSTVTFLIGENGSGKSTLLEALAECCGFNPEGGSRDHHRATFADRSPLAQALRLSWSRKVTEGFFMRAESFYNFASYIEQVSDMRAYGGKSLHAQSHGESFLSLFANRFEQGIYILDEPEAALSPRTIAQMVPSQRWLAGTVIAAIATITVRAIRGRQTGHVGACRMMDQVEASC
jgi:predicted ATPase